MWSPHRLRVADASAMRRPRQRGDIGPPASSRIADAPPMRHDPPTPSAPTPSGRPRLQSELIVRMRDT
eukprot:9502183-Pyramimonas_sp.AAC.1